MFFLPYCWVTESESLCWMFSTHLFCVKLTLYCVGTTFNPVLSVCVRCVCVCVSFSFVREAFTVLTLLCYRIQWSFYRWAHSLHTLHTYPVSCWIQSTGHSLPSHTGLGHTPMWCQGHRLCRRSPAGTQQIDVLTSSFITSVTPAVWPASRRFCDVCSVLSSYSILRCSKEG